VAGVVACCLVALILIANIAESSARPIAEDGTTLADGMGNLNGLTIHNSTLYWIAYDSVASCSTMGCITGPTILASYLDYPEFIAVDSTHVYWLGYDSTSKCSLSGCENTTLIAYDIYASGLAVYGGRMYWIDMVNNYVVLCGVMGCGNSPSRLVHLNADPFTVSLTVDTTTVYWAEYASFIGFAQGIWKCAMSGCNNTPFEVVRLPSGSGIVYSLTVDSSHVYFINDDAVHRCDISGCAQSTVLTTHLATSVHLALDGNDVFFTKSLTNSVVKCAKSGCDNRPTTIARTNSASPSHIVVDNDNVYWVDADNYGAVEMSSKNGGGSKG